MGSADQLDWSPADNLPAIALSEAGAWRHAIDLCAARMRTDPLTEQTDARLFLLALRQLMRAARFAAKLVRQDPGKSTALAAAQKSFDQALPGAKDACDMIEHFDDYAAGTGNLQHKDPLAGRIAAARDWPTSYDKDSGTVTLGTIQLHVDRACEQAKLLQLAIWRAVHDL